MGRARGGTDTVAGTARLRSPARRLTALGRDLWTDKAETLLLTLLTGRRSRLAFCRGTEMISGTAVSQLQAGLPRRWVYDTIVAEAAPAVQHPRAVRVLRAYLTARLREDRALLVSEAVLSAEAAQALSGRIDDERSWAALRAADLLRAHQEVRDAELGEDAEAELARSHLAGWCRSAAEQQFWENTLACHRPHPPAGDTDLTLPLLAFTRALADPDLGQARMVLYQQGELARTRAMMKEVGLPTDAPAIFADFAQLEAAFEFRGPLKANSRGVCNRALGVAALNPKTTLATLRTAQDSGGHCETLVHELIHTRQRADYILDPQHTTLGADALHRTLLEGATESEAQLLAPGAAEAATIYPRERIFVRALADLCCQDGDTRNFIRELADCSDLVRLDRAALGLLGTSSDDAHSQLAAAHWRFVTADPAGDATSAGEDEAYRSARAYLSEIRSHPLRGEELWAWSGTVFRNSRVRAGCAAGAQRRPQASERQTF